MVVDTLLRRAGVRARRGSGDLLAAEITLGAQRVLLVKPSTYVNRTGRAVLQLQAAHGFATADVLAIVDDVYLPFGRLRLRPNGSAGGHNGLRSMIESLGSQEFPRLRMGVGQPEAGTMPLPDWVLGPFTKEERAELPDFEARAADAVEQIVAHGVAAALPRINAPPG
jgi:PTH1 family peptidyl-tRNA hydrolase